MAVRFTQGGAAAKLGDAHMEAGVSLGRFEIQDLLVGPRSRNLAFLARSFEAGEPGMWVLLTQACVMCPSGALITLFLWLRVLEPGAYPQYEDCSGTAPAEVSIVQHELV